MAVSISFSGFACLGASEEIILSGYLDLSFLLDHVQLTQRYENLQHQVFTSIRCEQKCDYFFFNLSLP